MKRIHILRTAVTAADCGPLFTAAADLGLRVGWLDLGSAAGIPAELEAAAGLGAFRAVAVAGKRVIAVKPVPGRKVLKDLLREHFAGCRLVLIQGELTAPELTVVESGYRVRFDDGSERAFSAEALARALRKPSLRRSSG